jgi:outer membrane protein assembly factor BamB
MSSSPVVVTGTVVVQIENYADSFAAGIDGETGETRWRVERPAMANWCSPASMRSPDGGEIVLLQSPSKLTAHDPLTGAELWRHEAKCESIPSVVGTGRLVVLPANGLTVLELEGSSPKVLWESSRMRSGSSSPVTDGESIYVLNSAGVLTSAKSSSGDIQWQVRIGGTFWATPIIAGEHLLCINQEGKAKVVKLGADKGEIVGEADFGEKIQGTPAIADGAIFVRSDRHLWKISATR